MATKISAALVKELRERTGAGMMECKKALVEAQGEMEQAEEVLAKAGQRKVAKSASRVAAEGLIVSALSDNKQQGVIVEINSETDFVARDASFKAFAAQLAETALVQKIDTVEALLEAKIETQSIEQLRQALVAKIGENIQVRRLTLLNAQANQYVGAYVHDNRLGALILVQGGDENVAKDLAMHAAAMKPQYIQLSEIPVAIQEKQREIFTEVAQKSDKPADMLEKIIERQLDKHFNELCLLGQAFIKQPKQSVAELLAAKQAEVVQMVRFEVGEGIEVNKKSFEEEVMEQARGSH